MKRALSLFAILFAYWLLLSGKFHVADPHGADRFLTACGVASCAFVVWLAARKMRILDAESHPVQHIVRAGPYALWLGWQIVLSNWDVFKRVWSPSLPIDPCVVTIPYTTQSDLGTALYANSITLTPGTVTIDVDPERRTMTIHCLTRGVASDLEAGGMLAKVRWFEGSA